MTVDLDELERLANAAGVKEPTPWKGVEDEVHGPPDDNVPPGYDPTNRVASGIYFIETRDYIAAANPAVVLDLVRRLRAAEGIVRDLADGGDPISPGIAACAVCRAWQPGAEPMKLTDHDEDCAYRRATEYVK